MKKVAFICIHNACRSQMAEGFAAAMGKGVLKAYSAGTEKYPEVNPNAVKVMQEIGISMAGHHPKLLENIPPVDIVVTMGCGVSCPYLPCSHREDWALDDPLGKDIAAFRKTRDIIKEKVQDLIARVKTGKI